MSSEDSGPEVVENNRNEANRPQLNRPQSASFGCSLISSDDFPIVECSLSELSYCYCVDERREDGGSARRKLKSTARPVDFDTYQADMLSQLSTKQLLLNRKPTLIDNLISRNRSALLQNRMEGRRGGGRPRGRKPSGAGPGRPPLFKNRSLKEQDTPPAKKRPDSEDTDPPAVKRLRRSAREEGDTSDGGGSSASNTSQERAPSSTARTNATQKKRKLKKEVRCSSRNVHILRNGKKRVNHKNQFEIGLQKKILKNAIKSKLALADKKSGGAAATADKLTANITDSNSNLFTEADGAVEPGKEEPPPQPRKRGRKPKRIDGKPPEPKEPAVRADDAPPKVVKKKRRKRDSMWVKRVRKHIKPSIVITDGSNCDTPKPPEPEKPEENDPPSLDSAPPEEPRSSGDAGPPPSDIKTEPKMPVLECQIEDKPPPPPPVLALSHIVKTEVEPALADNRQDSEPQVEPKSETANLISDEKVCSENSEKESTVKNDQNLVINKEDVLCQTTAVSDDGKEEEKSDKDIPQGDAAVLLPEQTNNVCAVGETNVIFDILEDGRESKVEEKCSENDETVETTRTEVLNEVSKKEDGATLPAEEAPPTEIKKAEEELGTEKTAEGPVGLADNGVNDADSTSDVPTVLDEPSADDSLNDLSLYLPIEELEQLKTVKVSSDSCGSFANISDRSKVTKHDQEEEILVGEKEKQLSSTEIEQTLKDLSDIAEREISRTPKTATVEEEDSCKDSGIQLEEQFSSDKENTASSCSFPENGAKTDPPIDPEEHGGECEEKAKAVEQNCKNEETERKELMEIVEKEEQEEVATEENPVAEDPATCIERQAMKEAVLQALGLKSLSAAAQPPAASASAAEKPKRVHDSGYTGTLKAIIKVNRGGDKKSRTMVYRRSDDKTAIDKLEYKMICSEAQDLENSSTGSEMGSCLSASTKPHQCSPCLKDGHHHSETADNSPANLNGSQFHGAEGVEADDKNGGKESSLVIPEKSSSFSIHPGRLCSDVCSYCFGKFGSLDTPCHVAQLKGEERQRKILENEPHLTVESCLCDACYRYVDRRANCPNGAGGRTKSRPKPPASSICCVTECKELATHTVKRKWLLKLKKSITNKLDIDMEKPGSMYYPLCAQHHYWVDYFTVCGICRKRLNRNHLYSLGPETDRLNLMLAQDGIPARLSDKLFLCKLCRYYSNLRLKYSDPLSIPATNLPFYKSHRKKILTSLEVPVSDSEDEAQVVDKKKSKKCEESKANKSSSGVGVGGDSKGPSSEGGSGLEDEMALRGLASLLGDSQAEQQTRIQVKFGNVNIGTLSNLNIGQHGRTTEERGSRRYMGGSTAGTVEAPHLPLSAHLDFQGPSTPDGSWERCISTIQFDKRTKKLWQDLQRPYGNQSSFLRHLVMLEKYWRCGYLVLSEGADPKAAKYVNSVLNRLKAFEGTDVRPPSKTPPAPPSPAPSPSPVTKTPPEKITVPSPNRYRESSADAQAYRSIINTTEIEVTPIVSGMVSSKPNGSSRPAGSCRSGAQAQTAPAVQTTFEAALARQPKKQPMAGVFPLVPTATPLTALNRAKSLVRMVSPPPPVAPVEARLLAKPPPPLLKIAPGQHGPRGPTQPYTVSSGGGGVRLLLQAPRYPAPPHRPPPKAYQRPLKPILPKLPRALTVTQVCAGPAGPAITLHGSGITIEKQSGNSPLSTAVLPPEKPSISVFREPMPTPD